MRGRRPTPTALKLVAGTARKCRTNDAEPVVTVAAPQPPAWLSERAAAIFCETVIDMMSMDTAAVEWTSAIADYASAREEVELTTAIIEDLGRTYKTEGPNGTMYRARPEVAMRGDAMRRTQALRAELGLGPASKSRVSASKTPRRNPFLDL